jgi:predicted choloylglycine hydrolase
MITLRGPLMFLTLATLISLAWIFKGHATAEESAIANEPEIIRPESIPVFRGTSDEIGTAYGKMFGAEARLLASQWLRPHMRLAALTGPLAVNRKTRTMIAHLPREMQREVRAFARAAQMSEDDAFKANFASDLLQMATWPLGCSTYVVMPHRSASGAMIYGRNLDYFKSDILRAYWRPIVFARTGMNKVLTLSIPGHSGVMTGVNESGVVMSIMVSFSPETYTAEGIASLFVFRLVLERAGTAAQARDLYTSYPRTVPVNVMIADGTDAFVIEAGVNKHAVRTPGANGVLYAANHFEDPSVAHPRHQRDQRWPVLGRLDETGEPIDYQMVRDLIADAARENPAAIAQNILAMMVDFKAGRLVFGSDDPVAIEGRLKAIDYREVLSR